MGYYEIGVLQSIYNNLFKNAKKSRAVNENNNNTEQQQQFFDIVAGVSIGAINAVFLVNYVLKNNGKWDDSPSKLKEFWNNFKAHTYAESNPMFDLFWNGLRFFNSGLASAEAARRYWSFYELACLTPPFGGMSPNLCNSFFKADTKYFSHLNNFLSYDYKPLMNLMEKNINYPIKTDFEKNQPRLLLLSVDVKDCSTAVTFDSYRSYKRTCDICGKDVTQNKLLAKHVIEHIKEISNNGKNIDKQILSKSIPTSDSSSLTDTTTVATNSRDKSDDLSINSQEHIWTSLYGDENNDDRIHVVSYNGIDNDILMSSCLFPYSSHHTILYDLVSKEKRTFWDGAFLSNTPLRELIQKHKDFWVDYFEANGIDYDKTGIHESEIYQNDKPRQSPTIPKIPDLEIFIANLYPAVETQDDPIPKYKDKIEDRMNDLRFHDRSVYDEKVAHLVTDYVDLTRRLIKLAKETGKVDDEQINEILEITGESTKRDVKKRRNLSSLVKDKFRVRVYRIDRQDDKDTIFGKASDFTPTTLEKLYNDGMTDADTWFKDLYEGWQIEI